jgi:Mrp family chromosome partitioning ATPase
MRSTLLVDADLERRPVTSILRLPSADGLAGILNGGGDLSEVTVQVPVGRDRLLDVVPSGRDQRGPLANREAEVLRDAIARTARHYELTVVVSSFGQANDVRIAPVVLVCAHIAHSLVSTVRAAVASLRDSGAQITGIVLWAADAPSLEPPWIFESWFTNTNDRAADAGLIASDR